LHQKKGLAFPNSRLCKAARLLGYEVDAVSFGSCHRDSVLSFYDRENNQANEPHELRQSKPGEYRIATHGSLVISSGYQYKNRIR